MTRKYCTDCGKEIFGWRAIRCHKCANHIITRSFVGKKLSVEHKDKLKASWDYSKHITPEWRKKQSVVRKGISVVPIGSKWSTEQRTKIMQSRKPWTNERRLAHSLAHRGSASYSWKGGVTPLMISIRRSSKHRGWSKSVMTRDNYTCTMCGSRNGGGKKIVLNADHIQPFSSIVDKYNIDTYEKAYGCEELWDVNNGRTLCTNCHRKTDTYGYRGKKS